MDLGLKGKVVVITGGTKGIGRACVEEFLREGSRVVACARSQKDIEKFNSEFNQAQAFAVVADVSVFGDMEQVAKEAVARFGSLDVWINNAGIYPSGYLDEMPLDLWLKTFDVNVHGVLYGSRAAIPYMKEKRKGVIINAASYAVIMPTAARGAYGITKAAVGHMTKVMGAELAPFDIRVVAYMPGFIVTELTQGVIDDYAANEIKKQVAQNRYGTPEEVAPMVAFLASDKASFITGCGLEMSGGKYCVQNPHKSWERLAKNED